MTENSYLMKFLEQVDLDELEMRVAHIFRTLDVDLKAAAAEVDQNFRDQSALADKEHENAWNAKFRPGPERTRQKAVIRWRHAEAIKNSTDQRRWSAYADLEARAAIRAARRILDVCHEGWDSATRAWLLAHVSILRHDAHRSIEESRRHCQKADVIEQRISVAS
jgi:hypothetical protein